MKTVKLVLTALLAVLFVSGCSQEEQQDILSRLDTLEKVTIASIQGQLTTINGTIGSLQGTQTQLSGYVTSLQTTVGGLQGDYSSLQSLVNSLKEKDDSFAGELKSLKDYIDQCDGDVKAWVEKSYTSLEKFNALQETVSGINTSITTINGRLDALDSSTQKIAADLKEKTDTLTNRLSRSQIEIEGIKSDLKKLQDEMDSVKEQMAAIVSAVQSVVVVPDYSDGSVKMTGGAENPLRFEVYPLEAAKNLAALGASALSLDCVETKTKSSIFTNIPISGVSFDGEVLQVVANGSNLPDAVKSGDTAINARLRISDGTVTRSSEYFFLKYKETNDNLNDNQQFEIRYTTTDGSMVDIKDYTHIVNHYTDNESGENVIVLDIAQVPDYVFRNDIVYPYNSSLNTVSISAGIRHIASYAFSGCSSLTSVTIPESVISIGEYAFYSCSSLTSITIPESVISIGPGAFGGCSSLNEIIVLCSAPPSLGSNAFNNTNNAPIYVPDESKEAYKTAWSVYADRINRITAVDLGLSVMWARCNLGASKPEDYGDYYAWGETEPKENYSWSNYKFGTSSSGPFSKYNTNSTYGPVDNKTVLDPEDDVAHVKLGGEWRMPTDEEWTELRTKCTWTWTDNYNGTGVTGRIVTATNGNSIFLPAAGYREDTNLNLAGSYGHYWSSSLSTGSPGRAWNVRFSSDGVDRYTSLYRYYGRSVRPVYSKDMRLSGRWNVWRSADNPDDYNFSLIFSGNKLDVYIIAWGVHVSGTYTYANNEVTYNITTAQKAWSDVTFNEKGEMETYSWMAGDMDKDTFELVPGYAWYPLSEDDPSYPGALLSKFIFELTSDITANTSLQGEKAYKSY